MALEDRVIENLHSLQTDEQALVPDQVGVLVPLAQLVRPVDTPSLDEDDGQRKETEVEPSATVQGASRSALEIAYEVVSKSQTEEGENHDLQDETRQGYVDSSLAATRRDRRDGSTGGLEDKTDNVGGDEDVVEDFWSEAGDLRCQSAYTGRSVSVSSGLLVGIPTF